MNFRFFRRWLPTLKTLEKTPGLGALSQQLHQHPQLFQYNRRTVSTAFFIGLFFAYVPSPGQAFMAATAAFFARANLPIALVLVWASNPFTLPFFVISAYTAGAWVLGSPALNLPENITWDWFQSLGHLVWPFVLGSLIMGLLSGSAAFVAIQGLWRLNSRWRWQQRRQRKTPL